jgi:predicted dienelactone hydrolase
VKTPLDELPFPVTCISCGAGPFQDAVAVDEHITEEHLALAVWAFAHDNMERARELI